MAKNFLKVVMVFLLCGSVLYAQQIPSPKEYFGFNIGDDYHLANYTQTEGYFKKVAQLSDRVVLKDIGKTEEGRTQYMMIISSPENLKQLDRYKKISQTLARAEITEAEADNLEKQGKAIVWIDGGLHANETVGSQQLIQLYYDLVTKTDVETNRILANVIILLSEVNPDGQELVANWYMRKKDSSERNMMIPRLFQKYIGHDNNRDFYMMNMKETQNIARQQYIEWMPQIVYNHHQSGPPGSVVAGPPYRPPFNYAYDPLLVTGIDGVAAAMINRLNAENKPGYTRLNGSQFNGWWDGGLRTAPYYHNMIGLLTEIIGNPTPSKVPLVPKRLLSDNATPNPIMPQTWKFRQSIDYSVSLNYAVLDYAERTRDQLLRNIYLMGRNSINRGSRDHWTIEPKLIDSIQAAYDRDKKSGLVKSPPSRRGETLLPDKYYNDVLKSPSFRDPRGYIIPSSQTDFPTAVKFINALIRSGLKIYKATTTFEVKGKSYPQGSYIIKTAQAFRPHVLDMFEPQDYPNDFEYPGGPPIRPYDVAGWTLAYQMGIKFDRIMDSFSGPFKQIPYGELQSPLVSAVQRSKKGYLLNVAINNSFIAVNDLLKKGVPVWRTTKGTAAVPAGSFYIPPKGYEFLKAIGQKLGLKVSPADVKPSEMAKITPGRIGLFDHYGGSIPSGWVRWLMEKYHYAFTLVYPQDIDSGNLRSKYDVLLFIDDGIPPTAHGSARRTGFSRPVPKAAEIPEKYRHMLGSLTVNKSIPSIKSFIENGGTVVTIGENTRLAYHLGLPVRNALTKASQSGKDVALSGDQYYIPTSILKVNINQSNSPATWGMPAVTDIVFNNSPVFKIDAGNIPVDTIASFGKSNALVSGWAWGQSYLKSGIAAFSASIGKGKLYAFGPEITFRGQSQGTFRMLFNELYVMH